MPAEIRSPRVMSARMTASRTVVMESIDHGGDSGPRRSAVRCNSHDAASLRSDVVVSSVTSASDSVRLPPTSLLPTYRGRRSPSSAYILDNCCRRHGGGGPPNRRDRSHARAGRGGSGCDGGVERIVADRHDCAAGRPWLLTCSDSPASTRRSTSALLLRISRWVIESM